MLIFGDRDRVPVPKFLFIITMVQFNELRISDDGAKLIIDVEVPDIIGYEDIVINNIYIDTINDLEGKSIPQQSHKLNGEDLLDTKHYQGEFTVSNPGITDLTNSLLFITVETNENFPADTPCGFDEKLTVGVTFYTKPFYDGMINSIKQFLASNQCSEDPCAQPNTFVSQMLEYEGLMLALYNGCYDEAIQFYKDFFTQKSSVNIKKCNCNGRS